ncbi:unnamed protein product, partial [Polarella glacialis]
ELLLDDNGPQLLRGSQAAKAAADELLDLVVAVESQDGPDGRWTKRIQEFRFKSLNEEWCQAVLLRTKGGHPTGRQDVGAKKLDSSETRAPSLELQSRRGPARSPAKNESLSSTLGASGSKRSASTKREKLSRTVGSFAAQREPSLE